ncbi:MAG: glycerol-3-phosphate 1-O-acyltransferase PlsY [Lentisphaeraceae bacterium]|nr:glycerol-3-phosphate 1-O-acyltransferase PlsY [Lentisphaeraceae bacterium]
MTLPMLIGIVVVSCYLIGSIPFGLLIGKLNNIDIREHGSGNIGATNVLRTLGKKWGYICFTLDFLKGLLPVIFATKLAVQSNIGGQEYIPSIAIVSTVLGHVFSLFLKFKGGKGIATSAGAIMAIAPFTFITGLIFWFIILKMTGYVSLASILAAVVIPFLAIGSNAFELQSKAISNYSIGILVLIAVLVTLKHKTNILRLKNGTEPSFKDKAKK